MEQVPTSLGGADIRGPVALGVAWRRNPPPQPFEGFALAGLARKVGWAKPPSDDCRSALVLTNAGIARVRLDNEEGAELLGDVADLVDHHQRIRRRVPSLLGVRDLSDLIDDEVAARSSWDRDAALALTRVFVPTRAYRATLDVLDRHAFAVVSGPPEMGKTAIARMLGLALHTEGWEVHECIRPEQVFAAYNAGRRQLFVADDAFGSTEYRPDAAERWALELDQILRSMDERHWLVWTSRPAPLRAGLARIHREHGVERFPRPAEVHVDAAALDLEERATILYRHARTAELTRQAIALVREHGVQIVEHAHFTPERIRRFVATRLPALASGLRQAGLHAVIAEEIAEPTEAMAASFDALAPEHRALLLALVDSPPGPVSERELMTSARRHSPAGLPRPPAELIDRLTDHFVRIVPPAGITWVHPSWRDLVIDRLASDPEERQSFLASCSVEGVLLALSRGGGRTGERIRPLLQDDSDWDALHARLLEIVPELADPDLIRLFAAFEDGLRIEHEAYDPDAGELAAVARTTLSRIARCWDTRQSFATFGLLRRWEEVSSLLRDAPTPPDHPKLWAPPPAESYEGARDRHADPLPETGWDGEELSMRERIVDRILSGPRRRLRKRDARGSGSVSLSAAARADAARGRRTCSTSL